MSNRVCLDVLESALPQMFEQAQVIRMKFQVGSFRNLAVTFRVADLIVVALTAAVVASFAAVAGGAFSWLALLACEAVFLSFYLVGSLLAGFQPLAAGIPFDLPLRLLVGYTVINTALFVLAWLSPLSIIQNFSIVFALAAALFVATRPRREASGSSASLWVVGICLVATALWCQDSLRPISVQGDTVLVKPWIDGFYHAVHIRIFGASHGASSIEDFRLAGVLARPYHYGAYLMPALIKQLSGIASYTAFAGILAPVGVLFTGLAAYAFVASWWGAWPGLTAAAALLLLPDGVQQGIRNPFMSYHWLTQISPTASYGLALLAVAWLFVIRGCARGSLLQVFAGWLVSLILVFYKLHFFIASALLLLLVPPVFFRGRFSVRQRILWTVLASGAYLLAISYGQKVPGVPLIRFDGSCIAEILRLIQSFAMPSTLRDYLADHMGTDSSTASNLLFGVPYVLLASLGVFVPLLVVLIVRLRKRLSLLELLFPILLIVNFLAMFFGLALDFASSTPDELSHRPVLVVYFFVVVWIGGVLGKLLFESKRWERAARPLALGLTVPLLAIPALLGAGVQRMWAMSQISPVRAPLGLVRAAQYIREHSEPNDLFQDSQFDRTCLVAAFSERRPFVARTMTRMPYRSDLVESRAFAIEHFMHLHKPKTIAAIAKTFGFRWFLLEPGDQVDWPAAIVDHPVFEMGRFKVYRF